MNFGPTELLIILAIVVLLFGIGRVGKIGGELGSAVANFRKGMTNASAESQPAQTDPVDVSSAS